MLEERHLFTAAKHSSVEQGAEDVEVSTPGTLHFLLNFAVNLNLFFKNLH